MNGHVTGRTASRRMVACSRRRRSGAAATRAPSSAAPAPAAAAQSEPNTAAAAAPPASKAPSGTPYTSAAPASTKLSGSVTVTVAPTGMFWLEASVKRSLAATRYHRQAPSQPLQRGGGSISTVIASGPECRTTPIALQPEEEMERSSNYSLTSEDAIVRTVCRGTSPIAVTLRPRTVVEYAFVLPTVEKPSRTSAWVAGSSMNTDTVARPSE